MELLVVVVIIGILTSIAYPNYRQFVAKAKRSEAKAALLQIAARQEGFYLQNNTYTTDLTSLGFDAASDVITSSEAYVVNVTAADANSFAANATYRIADQEANKCATFTINGQGLKGSGPATDCWTNNSR